jgi:hypothetical protein
MIPFSREDASVAYEAKAERGRSKVEVEEDDEEGEGDARRTWQRRMDEARAKHRPKLKNWSRDGFATRRRSDFDALKSLSLGFRDIKDAKTASCTALGLDATSLREVDRISCKRLDYQTFINIYEQPGMPCIISRVPEVEEWPAAERWLEWSYLKSSVRDRLFKVGEDDDGYAVKVGVFCYYRVCGSLLNRSFGFTGQNALFPRIRQQQ